MTGLSYKPSKIGEMDRYTGIVLIGTCVESLGAERACPIEHLSKNLLRKQ
jgi:hypothetical protein